MEDPQAADQHDPSTKSGASEPGASPGADEGSVGPQVDPLDPVGQRYLDLLRGCLTREIFLDQEWWDVRLDDVEGGRDSVAPMLSANGWRLVRRGEVGDRAEGRDWPPTAETMIGTARLENLTRCCVAALQRRVPGDFVETGVWRGGATILMRGVLEALGDPERSVWVADSFDGLPVPDPDRYPADEGLDWSHVGVLKVDADDVRSNFARYDLLDERVRFLEGWFCDTLPSSGIDRIAVLRLDGDLYQSTMDALEALEPRVSPGGFVIVDDYGGWEPCRAAVSDYRARNGIDSPIRSVDWTGAWWQK